MVKMLWRRVLRVPAGFLQKFNKALIRVVRFGLKVLSKDLGSRN